MTTTYPGPDGARIAQLACAIRANLDHTAVITGTKGRIKIPLFWGATTATLHTEGHDPDVVSAPHACNGFEYQIAHVAQMVRGGAPESPTMSLDDSIDLARSCQAARRLLEVTYPFESNVP